MRMREVKRRLRNSNFSVDDKVAIYKAMLGTPERLVKRRLHTKLFTTWDRWMGVLRSHCFREGDQVVVSPFAARRLFKREHGGIIPDSVTGDHPEPLIGEIYHVYEDVVCVKFNVGWCQATYAIASFRRSSRRKLGGSCLTLRDIKPTLQQRIINVSLRGPDE